MVTTQRSLAINGPIAYFITFRTYGTWLPGDERGFGDRRHKEVGTSRRPADKSREAAARDRMKHQAVVLNDQARTIVEAAIRRRCDEAGWALHALEVRPTHTHALVSSALRAGQVLSSLKAAATAALHNADAFSAEQPVWSRQGSTKYLWNELQAARVNSYIEECQDDPDRPLPLW